jgi:large subunit ribosomal protein L4
MKTQILSLDNVASGEIELSDTVFGLEPRVDLIQRVTVWQLAKRRAGTHAILTRGLVNRSHKKVYKQKGTGQARHGSRTVSQYVGGAKAMGPVPHSHEFDLPKKVRALGLKHALSSKVKDGSLVIISDAVSKETKTNVLAKQLAALGANNSLVVDSTFDENFALSARNLGEVSLVPVIGINVYDIMRRKKLVLTTSAVKAIEERLA